jgi:hypothetical protein
VVVRIGRVVNEVVVVAWGAKLDGATDPSVEVSTGFSADPVHDTKTKQATVGNNASRFVKRPSNTARRGRVLTIGHRNQEAIEAFAPPHDSQLTRESRHLGAR